MNNYIKVENYIQSNSNALKTNEVSDNAQSSIKKIYAQNLQNDLKTKLKEKGYISNNINISISNDDKYNIERIDIKVDEKVTNSNQDEKQVKTIVDNIKAIKIKVKKDDSQNNAIITENDKNEIKEYKEYIKMQAADPDVDKEALAQQLLVRIGFYQHERLIHLIVTMSFAIFFLLSLILVSINVYFLALSVLLLVLLVPYIAHYYFLENSTQELYKVYYSLISGQ